MTSRVKRAKYKAARGPYGTKAGVFVERGGGRAVRYGMEMYSYRMPRESTYNAVKQFPGVLLSYRLRSKRNVSIYSRTTDTAPCRTAATFHVRPYSAHVFSKLLAFIYVSCQLSIGRFSIRESIEQFHHDLVSRDTLDQIVCKKKK